MGRRIRDICLALEVGSVFYGGWGGWGGGCCNVDEYSPVQNHSLMSANNLLQLVGWFIGMLGLNTWQQLTQPSLAFLLMGCHTQRRFQPMLVHLKVSRTATKMEDTRNAARTHPRFIYSVVEIQKNKMCLSPLDEKNRSSGWWFL